MKIGFIGTQNGMTDAQKRWLVDEFSKIEGAWEFHAGDCVGSDTETVRIAKKFDAWVAWFPS